MPSGAKSPGPARNATVARETGVERLGQPLLDLLEAGTLERREIRIGDEIDARRPGNDRLEERSRPLEATVTRRRAGATTLQSGLRRAAEPRRVRERVAPLSNRRRRLSRALP